MVHPTTLGKYSKLHHQQTGFTYLLVLGFVFALLLSLTIASENINTTIQREREAELLFIGQQYRNAIASYYQKSPNGIKQLPLKLEDLLEDKRSLTLQHHLRQLYRDPMTESGEWGLVRDGQGQISGVYSLSQDTPMMTQEDTRFALDASTDGNAKTYSSWKFVFKPNNANSLATPAQNGASGAQMLQPAEIQN